MDLKLKSPGKSTVSRMFSCMFRQRKRNINCPESPRLAGKTAIVTGGSSGVGEFVSRGLIERGAKVISLSRGVSKSTAEIPGLKSVKCDLGNPRSVVEAVDRISNEKIDLLIGNAGIVVSSFQLTSDDIEKTFAVNVLGHHLLYSLLNRRGLFNDQARIVLTTGEAYVMAKECLPAPSYSSFSGHVAYAASKLGNLWQVQELANRWPHIKSIAVHPGVICSGLGGGPSNGLSRFLMSRLLISEKQGAQGSLIGATQDLPNGAYWHNTLGLLNLRSSDVARDRVKSEELWESLEQISSQWL